MSTAQERDLVIYGVRYPSVAVCGVSEFTNTEQLLMDIKEAGVTSSNHAEFMILLAWLTQGRDAYKNILGGVKTGAGLPGRGSKILIHTTNRLVWRQLTGEAGVYSPLLAELYTGIQKEIRDSGFVFNYFYVGPYQDGPYPSPKYPKYVYDLMKKSKEFAKILEEDK